MRYEDLSAADQALLNTDFGDLEKEASARVEVAQEMYSMGFDKLASATADEMDKAAAEAECKKEDKKEEHDEEKKAASEECGKIIEKGFFDGLRKLGSDRHGNELHYLLPFIEEKVAAVGARAALEKFASKLDNLKGMASKAMSSAKSTAKGFSPGAIGDHARQAASGKPVGKSLGQHSFGAHNLSDLTKKERVMEGAKALGKASPYAALAGGAGYGAAKASKKKED